MKAHSSGQRSVSQDSVTSPKTTQATKEQTGSPETGSLSAVHAEASGLSPPVLPQTACHKAASPRSAAKHTRTGHVCDSKGPKRGGKSSGDLQSDTLTHQTKFFVLQFLHESMNEESLLYLSQSSFSNTSESESRCLSHAEKLRKQWQFNRGSQSSSPIFQSAHSKPNKQKLKPKCSKAFQTPMDESHRKNVLPQAKPSKAKRRVPSTTAGTDKTKPARLLRQNALQDCHQDKLLRSISENTESSDCGTYVSDADDELDGSHNSSQQGSVTSRSFREKLSQYYKQCNAKRQKQQHAIKSQREQVHCDSPNFTSDRSVPCDLDIESASSILSLDMINLEQQPVSPTTQFARVNEYLVQISQTSVESNHHENLPSVELTDLDLQYLDAAAKELNPLQHDASQTCSDLDKQFDEEEQSISISVESDLEGNDDQEDDEDQVNDTEAACGGANPDEDNERIGGRRHSITAKLRLDGGDPEDATLLIDAVHALQQDIEEEMSSLESEIDEVLQTLHSDHFHSCTLNLSRSRSLSPEAAEVVRMLARIGDEVQQRHFQDLDKAVSQLLIGSCAGFFTYENFCKAAPQALDGEVDKLKQVATLLLYSQHVALHLSHFGRQGLNRVVDYTARMLVDTAADFIIGQGGWSPMLEPSSATPSSPDHPGPVLNPFLGPFTTSTTTSTNSQPPDLPGDDSTTSSTARPEQSQVVGEAVPKSVCIDAIKGSTEPSQIFTQEDPESLHLWEDVHGDSITEGLTIITDAVASDEDSKLQENSNGVDTHSLLHASSPGCKAISPSWSSGRHNPQEGARHFTFNSEVPGYASPQEVSTCPVPSQATEELSTLPLSSATSTIVTGENEEKEEEEETGESRQRKQRQHEEPTEILGTGGIVSDVCRTALNSSLSSKYTMVSLGLLALSAAAAFKFARRF